MNRRWTRDHDDEGAALVRERIAALGDRPSGWVPDVPGNTPPRPGTSGRTRGRRMRRQRNRLLAAVADRLPTSMRLLLDVRRGHLAVLAAMCLAALALTVVLVVAGRSEALVVPLKSTPSVTNNEGPDPPPAGASPAADSSPPSARTATAVSTSPGVLVVHVSGLVQHPGLVQLPPGSRVNDALQAAGGVVAGADLAGLNLARLVVDGEQIAVGIPPALDANAGSGGPTAGASGAPRAGPVDLNRATVQELDALPGVGPVLAQRIVDWRTQNGRFTSIEELQEIKGIGERTFAEISPHVRV